MGEEWWNKLTTHTHLHTHTDTHLLTVQRSLYCIFWNLVSALPAHSSTYPSTTWNTVLWMAWVKCMCSWSIAVCRESQTHCYEIYCVEMSLSCASVGLWKGKQQIGNCKSNFLETVYLIFWIICRHIMLATQYGMRENGHSRLLGNAMFKSNRK